MRFATIEATVEGPINGLEAFVAAQGLDLLNLRYRRARVVNPTDADWVYPDFNQSFTTHLGQLTKSLYLEPNLHVFADAGWGNAYGCVEATATKLIEAGSGDLLISAVRGSNLLPMLDQLFFEGHTFRNESTGEPFDTEGRKLLAADLQIGAGPIEAAFAEGARVVVAGCSDSTASTIGMAAAQYNWQWDEISKIAGAGAAATLVRELSHRQSFITDSPIAAIAGSVSPQGDFTVSVDADELLDLATRSELSLADVKCCWSEARTSAVSPGTTEVEGITGAENDGTWRLNLTYVHYGITTLLAFKTTEQASEFMDSLPGEIPMLTKACPATSPGCSWEPLPCDLEDDPCQIVLRIVADEAIQCETWSSLLIQSITQAGPHVEWLSPPPKVQAIGKIWPTRVPREQIDIAVDTRPAKEWY